MQGTGTRGGEQSQQFEVIMSLRQQWNLVALFVIVLVIVIWCYAKYDISQLQLIQGRSGSTDSVIHRENINTESPVRMIRLASKSGSVSYVNANNVTMFFKDGNGTKVLFVNGKDFQSSTNIDQVAKMLENPSDTQLIP